MGPKSWVDLTPPRPGQLGRYVKDLIRLKYSEFKNLASEVRFLKCYEELSPRRGRLNSWRVNSSWLYLLLLYFRIMDPCGDGGRATVARSHLGFPKKIRKIFCKTQNKFCKVILVFVRGLRRKYFITRPTKKHKKFTLYQNCPEKLKTDNIFWPLFFHFLTQLK